MFGHDDGIEFYLALAAQHAGPVLELGAGTGRIAIPLAKRGISVTAVDLSRSMLETGKKKAAEEGLSIAWVEGDFRSNRPPIPQSLIFVANNSFLHLHTRDDMERALQVSAGKYRILDEADQEVSRHELRLRMPFPAELEALLHYNGFLIESRVGNFDGAAFSGNVSK